MSHDYFPPYTPKSRLAKWFESRLPIMSFFWSAGVSFPVPRNLNYWWTSGVVLCFMLVAQIVTGVFLAMFYTPHVSMAFNSVERILRDVPYGFMVQPLHAVGASMFFLAVYVHMFRGLYYGSYKAPREVLWILGVILLLLMMATGFLGYTLPWGQMSVWGATVITNFFTAIPVVGGTVVEYLWGGYAVGNPTLNRFFSLHFLLPFMICGVVVLHVWALHVPGNNNPEGVEMKEKRDALPFHPYYTTKDFFAVFVFLILLAWFTFYMPRYLGHADNFIPADRLVTPSHIVPEWYFLPFYAILRAVDFDINLGIFTITSQLGGVIAMFASIILLVFLPWLDTSPVRSSKYRPIYKWFFWAFVITAIGLGWLGSKPPGVEKYVIASKILTAYYFAHILVVLPLVGRFEKPKAMPNSIFDAVLKKNGSALPDRGLTMPARDA